MGLHLENLKNAVAGAIENGAEYFGVCIKNDLNDQTEVIINTVHNMATGKLDYYLNAYTDKLELKTQPKIRITGFTYGDSFDDIQKDLAY